MKNPLRRKPWLIVMRTLAKDWTLDSFWTREEAVAALARYHELHGPTEALAVVARKAK